MAVNPLGGWTASSLVPSLAAPMPLDPGLATRQGVGTPVAQANNSFASPFMTNILTAIYGPNYQNMLGTGMVQPPAAAPANPALIEANAYASNMAARNGAMQQFQSYQGQLQQSQNRLASMNPNNMASYLAAQNNTMDLSNATNGAMRVSQAAALSPTAPPNVMGQQSLQAPFSGGSSASWNPYGLSGWLSPVQSGVSMPTPNMAQNIMGMGV